MKNEELIPPFSGETAAAKLQINENEWNTRDAGQIGLLYSENVEFSDKVTFLNGRAAVTEYLAKKFAEQHNYKVKKEVWGAKENRNAIRFQEEWQDQNGQWFHSYGNEQLEFDQAGIIIKRFGCNSDKEITSSERTL
ncbi:nuclear transport factor 2 (NTF2) superfamily protein [Mucilaginibacter sp. UYP25]|uniref:DUF1348 family protein n=1 Tax=unclassified Mucilaginibacter TaxID=2617802 RepID=UPI003397244E